ncbi:response regulator transcription factor [Rhodobacteraceae bacterium B1Z28]|uniref:Response regulator transcription factor n=1 Tax=Ruegeria haliotis TaxID=2747601 RepID=A0ABX2PSM5_9RHOB|nr:response regulator transcription factor [Ruegeria haliotis]NVO56690.1 response regulator transcription factor [Ruegeria haliotis]
MNTVGYPKAVGQVSNVLIVDDHPLYSDALAAALELSFEECRIKKAKTLKQTFEVLSGGFRPDLIMFDLKLPDVTGISGFQQLRERWPSVPVLVISSLASSELVRSLIEHGAMGFLPKDASAQTLKRVIGEIAAGRRYVPPEYSQVEETKSAKADVYESSPELSTLTPQQVRILKLICVGKSNKQIAYELSLAEATVKAHITALLRRLGVRNRTQAAVLVDSVLARRARHEPEVKSFLQH